MPRYERFRHQEPAVPQLLTPNTVIRYISDAMFENPDVRISPDEIDYQGRSVAAWSSVLNIGRSEIRQSRGRIITPGPDHYVYGQYAITSAISPDFLQWSIIAQNRPKISGAAEPVPVAAFWDFNHRGERFFGGVNIEDRSVMGDAAPPHIQVGLAQNFGIPLG